MCQLTNVIPFLRQKIYSCYYKIVNKMQFLFNKAVHGQLDYKIVFTINTKLFLYRLQLMEKSHLINSHNTMNLFLKLS